jgi:hypothetical protein
MDYAPFQAWVTETVINNPYRKQSGITDYDPVHTGNVSGGQLDISDPGQLGRANLPGLHMQTSVMDMHLNPSLAPADTLPTAIPRITRWVAFKGGQYNPFTYRNTKDETDDYEPVGTASQPMGGTGAAAFETYIPQHGPVTLDDLESGAGVRQPRRMRQRQFLRKLLMLPDDGYTMDPTGSHDERELHGMGEADKDTAFLTDAAVGTGNSFTVPDVRRTFDQPKDAPPGTPRDATGNPIYNKAGYRLTADALQNSPDRIDTSHMYPNFSAQTETAVGDSANRVRAGVQYDIQYTRPSVMPHWFYFRPWDQVIAEHNLALKGIIKPPQASRPVMVQDEFLSNVGWAAGRRYTAPPAGMTATAVMPNVNRQQPQAWDTDAYLSTLGGLDTRQERWRIS